jgi:hypothetical protein
MRRWNGWGDGLQIGWIGRLECLWHSVATVSTLARTAEAPAGSMNRRR